MFDIKNIPEEILNSGVSNLASTLKLSEEEIKAMFTQIVDLLNSAGEGKEEQKTDEASDSQYLQKPEMEIMVGK